MELKQVKQAIMQQSIVRYKNKNYVFYASRCFKNIREDRIEYDGELYDENANCVIHVQLSDVELIEK